MVVVVVYRRRWEGLRRDVHSGRVFDIIRENRVATTAATTTTVIIRRRKGKKGGRGRKSDRE